MNTEPTITELSRPQGPDNHTHTNSPSTGMLLRNVSQVTILCVYRVSLNLATYGKQMFISSGVCSVECLGAIAYVS